MILEGPEVLGSFGQEKRGWHSQGGGGSHSLEKWVEARLGKALAAKLLSLDLIH